MSADKLTYPISIGILRIEFITWGVSYGVDIPTNTVEFNIMYTFWLFNIKNKQS